MAMTLSHAARLKPEIRLAQAISEFEASLSNSQKADFRGWRAQSLTRAPDTTDVMRFTADIDRRITKGNRCLGPRFTSLLSSIQQFAALGDVVVGGSQNIIACGVWSLVRMSILAITNFSTYIESLSVVFMEIGRSSPRYEDLALHYPQSKSLQSSINEYFIILVRFCSSILQFAQKSPLRQIASSLSDIATKTVVSDLRTWAQEIRDEVQLLVAIKVKEEAEEQSRFRALSKKFSKSISHQQDIAAKLRILNKCSVYDHETTWKQIRKSGNTTLFARTVDYMQWRTSDRSCTLLYLGILGSGKSITMANIVDDLNLFVAQGQNALVVYFFVRHDLPASLKARTIVGAIVRQLLRSRQDLSQMTGAINESLDLEDMLSLLRSSFPEQQKTYLVLDGLDLCEHTERQELIQFLQNLQKYFLVLICASYRQESNVDLDTTLQIFQSVRAVSLPDNHSDIEAFIQTELSRRVETRSLILGDPSLILDIREALVSGSQGMFLWVTLQIHSLCTLQTDDEIRDALAHLPHDLSEIYAQLLRRQRGPATKYQRRILELITAAQRPLTTSEIQEALSVIPGDTTWSAAKLINDIFTTLATCGCLVIVDEEELTVRFVHPTVEQFLFDRYATDLGGCPVAIEVCHNTMSEVITTYLNYGIFKTDVSTFRIPQINGGSTPSKVITSTIRSSKSVQSIALKLLKLEKNHNFNMGRTIAGELKTNHRTEVLKFHFRQYAEDHCFDHVAKARHRGPRLKALFATLLEKDDISKSNSGSVIVDRDSWFSQSMISAVQSDDLELTEMLLQANKHYCHEEQRIHEALSEAICMGLDGMVRLLLTDPKASHYKSATLRSPLYAGALCHWAFRGDSESRVIRLDNLKTLTDSEISHICKSGKNLLACAVWGANMNTFEALLSDGRVNVNKGISAMSPIWEAVKGENGYALDKLLDSMTVRCDPKERAALIALATSIGNQNIVSSLQSPLRKAVKNGQTQAVESMLRRGGLYTNDEKRSDLIQLAEEAGHEDIVAMLQNPMQEAVRRSDVALVKRLLDSGSLDWEDGERTALIDLASALGNPEIENILRSLPEYANVRRQHSATSTLAIIPLQPRRMS